MIGLESPPALLLVAAAPLSLWLGERLARSGRGLRLPLAVPGGERFDGAPLVWRLARGLGLLLTGLGLAALGLAAAGPFQTSRVPLYTERGNAIMIVLDLSPSMAAADFSPTRLGAAKAIVKEFLATRRNESVGIVVFGAEASLVAPPTLDHAALASRLDGLEAGSLGEGTALGPGIAVAAASVLRASGPERHLILLSDGEANAGAIAPATAAAAASRAGIRVAVVGVGSRGDAPIEYLDPATGERRTGTYRSSFDAAVLEGIARAGGGEYYAASDAVALERAFDSLGARSATGGAARSVVRGESLAAPLLLLALAALALARLLDLAAGGALP